MPVVDCSRCWKPVKGTPVFVVDYKCKTISRFIAAGRTTLEQMTVGLPTEETGIAFSYTVRGVATKNCYQSKKAALTALVSYLKERRQNLIDNAAEIAKEIKNIKRTYR